MEATRVGVVAGEVARICGRVAAGSVQDDGELLGAFVESGDATAFAELVQRHGPMVLGVCLRVLRHQQDAEDAFQATFLVLARKAASILPRELVGNWLHGVAFNTARKARSRHMKRRDRETGLSDTPEPSAPAPEWDDVAEVLDEEFSRLPSHYRAVVLLCDVEGLSQKEAGSRLGCPEGSVASRLSRARAMLARRLDQRGVTLSSGALGLLVGQNAAVPVSATLLKSTFEVALAAGTSLAAVSPAVLTLANGVLKDMFRVRLMASLIVVLVVGLFGLGGAAGFGFFSGQLQEAGKEMTTEDCHEAKAPVPAAKPEKDKNMLQGTWHIVEVHINGKHQERENSKEQIWRFTMDNLVITYDDGSRVEMAYKVDQKGKPAAIDLSPRAEPENGPSYKGIYELDGDRLKLYYSRNVAPEAERPTEFNPNLDDRGMRYFILKREPKPAKPEKQDVQDEIIGAWAVVEFALDGKLATREMLEQARAYISDRRIDLRVPKAATSALDFAYRVVPEGINLSQKTDQEMNPLPGVFELKGDTMKIAFELTPDRPRPRRLESGKGMIYLQLKRPKAVSGLRIKLQPPQLKKDGKLPSHCVVVLENAGDTDLNVNLGVSLANGTAHHPVALRLFATEGKNTIRLTYAEPRVAGRSDPFVVPLLAGSSYTLRCPLDKFVRADGGGPLDFTAKDYRLEAALVGLPVRETSPDFQAFTRMPFWQGVVRSE